MRVIWGEGFMSIIHNDNEFVFDRYEIPEEDFQKMRAMLNELLNRTYRLGKTEKASEIRKALNIYKDA